MIEIVNKENHSDDCVWIDGQEGELNRSPLAPPTYQDSSNYKSWLWTQIKQRGKASSELYRLAELPNLKLSCSDPEGHAQVVMKSIEWIRHKKKTSKSEMCHLHVHSEFSLLDGVPLTETIANRAAALGHESVALTDHGYLHGLYKHNRDCKEAGIKPIFGVESYFCDDNTKKDNITYHLILIASNDAGWTNLLKINSLAGRDGFYRKPRTDYKTLYEYNEGIICLSGCYKSPVSYHFGPEGRDVSQAVVAMKNMKDIFGDRFYNEVMQIGWEDYDWVMPECVEIASEHGIKSVATNDCHYTLPEEGEVQNVLMNVSTKGGLSGLESQALYMKSRSEMEGGLISNEMLDRTLEIADRVSLDLKFEGYKFPRFSVEASPDYKQFQKECCHG
jgi:DNA polymerase III subunit alpha